jgi:hypothetical protein
MTEIIRESIQTFALTWTVGLVWGLFSFAYHLWEGKEF